MLMTYTAYLALSVCVAGIGLRVVRWSRTAIGPEASAFSTGRRLGAMFSAMWRTVASRKCWTLIKALFLEVLLQLQIARQSKARWAMHMGLFYGVALLILVHALDEYLVEGWVTDYASTLNPFMFLRHLLHDLWILSGDVVLLARILLQIKELPFILLVFAVETPVFPSRCQQMPTLGVTGFTVVPE